MNTFRQGLQRLIHKRLSTAQQAQISHCEDTRWHNGTNSAHQQHIFRFPINARQVKKRYQSATESQLIDRINICKCNKLLLISSLFWNTVYIVCKYNYKYNWRIFNINDITSGIRSIAIIFHTLQRISLMFSFVLNMYYSFLNTIYQIGNIFIILFCIVTFTVCTIITLVYIFIAQGLQETSNYTCSTAFLCDDDALALRVTIGAVSDMLWNIFFAIFLVKTGWAYKWQNLSALPTPMFWNLITAGAGNENGASNSSKSTKSGNRRRKKKNTISDKSSDNINSNQTATIEDIRVASVTSRRRALSDEDGLHI